MSETSNNVASPAEADATLAYWDSLADGVLRLQRCSNCGNLQWPVAPICRNCWSEAFDWEDVEPRGRLVTWCTYHRAFSNEFTDDVPYVVALVELDSGPQLITQLVEVDSSHLGIGETVEGVFEQRSNGRTLLNFRQAQDGGVKR